MSDRIAEIRERLEKATDGPWKAIIWGNEEYPYPLSIESEDGSSWIARDGTTSSLDNARLLASAPGDLSWLLTRMEEAERVMADVLAETVDSSTYSDGPNVSREVREDIRRWLRGETDGQ